MRAQAGGAGDDAGANGFRFSICRPTAGSEIFAPEFIAPGGLGGGEDQGVPEGKGVGGVKIGGGEDEFIVTVTVCVSADSHNSRRPPQAIRQSFFTSVL